MKKVVAVIRPFKLDAVQEALKAVGVQGMTVTEVRGYGRQRGVRESYRSGDVEVELLPKLKLEVVVEAEAGAKVEEVVEAIAAAARTGRVGDGKVVVEEVEDAWRIRTGEHGREALSSDPLADLSRELAQPRAPLPG